MWSYNEKQKELILSIIAKGKKEQEKNKLTDLKGDLSDQKKAVEVTKQVKDTLLTETKSKESAYQKLLADKEKKKAPARPAGGKK